MARLFLQAACALALFAAPAVAAPTAYTFGKDTTVTYQVVHPMHKVTGVTHTLVGTIAVEGDRLVTPATLKLPLATFDSGNANRDSNAAFALDAQRHPHAVLVVEAFEEKSRAKAGETTKLTGTAHGKLTLRGVTRPVAVPLTVALSPGALVVEGTFTVLLSHYKVPRPSLLFTPVNDDVTVVVHGVAAPAAR